MYNLFAQELCHGPRMHFVNVIDRNVLQITDSKAQFQNAEIIRSMNAHIMWRTPLKYWIIEYDKLKYDIHRDADTDFHFHDLKQTVRTNASVLCITLTKNRDFLGTIFYNHSYIWTLYDQHCIELRFMPNEHRFPVLFQDILYISFEKNFPATPVYGRYQLLARERDRSPMIRQTNSIRSCKELVLMRKARWRWHAEMRSAMCEEGYEGWKLLYYLLATKNLCYVTRRDKQTVQFLVLVRTMWKPYYLVENYPMFS